MQMLITMTIMTKAWVPDAVQPVYICVDCICCVVFGPAWYIRPGLALSLLNNCNHHHHRGCLHLLCHVCVCRWLPRQLFVRMDISYAYGLGVGHPSCVTAAQMILMALPLARIASKSFVLGHAFAHDMSLPSHYAWSCISITTLRLSKLSTPSKKLPKLIAFSSSCPFCRQSHDHQEIKFESLQLPITSCTVTHAACSPHGTLEKEWGTCFACLSHICVALRVTAFNRS